MLSLLCSCPFIFGTRSCCLESLYLAKYQLLRIELAQNEFLSYAAHLQKIEHPTRNYSLANQEFLSTRPPIPKFVSSLLNGTIDVSASHFSTNQALFYAFHFTLHNIIIKMDLIIYCSERLYNCDKIE